MALLPLLPRSLPGELTAGSLTHHDTAICSACSSDERLTAVGLAADDKRWFVNVRFAAQPRNVHLTLMLAGVPGAVKLQRENDQWQYIGGQAGGDPVISSVAERGDLVVIGLPRTLRATGLAVATAGGDRIPESGFVGTIYPSPRHFNVADAVFVVILIVAAMFGWRRGIVAEVGKLIAILLSLPTAVVVARPLMAIIVATGGHGIGARALAGFIVMVACATMSILVIPRLLRPIAPSAARLHPVAAGVSAAAIASISLLPLLAIALILGVDAQALHWAAPSITSSMLASALLDASKAVFGAV
jgi:hypothetical protein